ncbi:MAG: DUF3450 domain-containing protein [Gammaproteobacteria bacterium]|nr:MAG: DUF3450 domain-containing protein [Gammaproteobacteria bacterium]
MKTNRLKTVAVLAAVSLGSLAPVAAADQLDAVLKVGEVRTAQAQSSQKTIDRISDETGNLLQDYKRELKLIEDLKVYNAKLDIQIDNQVEELASIEEQTQTVTVTQRRIQPLAERMLDALEDFVRLDLPFHTQERYDRVKQIRANLNRANLSPAEKFRQVLEAYKIETEYGRKVEAYTDSIQIDGVDREVDILRVGRIALMYQTTDAKQTGVWDNELKQWVELPASEYRASVRNGIRMARKQASIDIMNLPIAAPEDVK